MEPASLLAAGARLAGPGRGAMLLWTGGPRWLTQAALWLLDTSPFGVGLSLLGVMPRPSSIIESVLRMMARLGLKTAR